MDNRRRHPRTPSHDTALLTVGRGNRSHSNSGAHFCSISDLSLGGLRVDLETKLQTGTGVAILVVFSAPEERLTRLGKVAWVCEADADHPYDTGLAFSDAGAAQSHVWRDAMIRRFPQVVEPLSEVDPTP